MEEFFKALDASGIALVFIFLLLIVDYVSSTSIKEPHLATRLSQVSSGLLFLELHNVLFLINTADLNLF